jgi:hypothetical protein
MTLAPGTKDPDAAPSGVTLAHDHRRPAGPAQRRLLTEVAADDAPVPYHEDTSTGDFFPAASRAAVAA